MKSRIFIVAALAEIQALAAEFLNNPSYDSLLEDMRRADPAQMRESYNSFEIKPEKEWVFENHEKFVGEVRQNGKIEWNWQLTAVLEELARAGKIEYGEYLIKVEDNE